MTRTGVMRTVASDLNALVEDGTLESWALCGGLALAVWGAPRATLDIDVLADPAAGRPVGETAKALVSKGWTLVEHARHPGDPVPELLRMTCGGVGIDLLIAHRNWETAMLAEASIVPWKGVGIPSVRVEALAAMKLRAGGPQDLVDAGVLKGCPDSTASVTQHGRRDSGRGSSRYGALRRELHRRLPRPRPAPLKLLLVAGARPNFMKIAPIVRALAAVSADGARDISWKIVHTGQHYDHEMSKVFFDELEIPEPDFHLECGSGSHAEQTARVMVAFEKVCLAERPDAVVVVGDVNSTLACAITAKKLGIAVAHVEAGLRSGDMAMPEEINRIVTDSISDWLFVTEESGNANLRREGHRDEDIHFVGNVMIDTLLHQIGNLERERAKGLKIAPLPATAWETDRPYAVVTLHRPSNVDDAPTLRGSLEALAVIAADLSIVFPVHPRTRLKIVEFGFAGIIGGAAITLLEPLPYRAFLALWKDATAPPLP